MADDGFAVDLPERGVFVNQHKLAVAERPGVHQALDHTVQQSRRCVQVDILPDRPALDPFGQKLPQGRDVAADCLCGLSVEVLIAQANRFGDNLKRDPFSQVNGGEVTPDRPVDGIESHDFPTLPFPGDIDNESLLNIA